jgi:ribosomal protein S18 acetylase RimI-like enzyme
MEPESASGAETIQIAVRLFSAEDRPFLTRVASRFHPGQTVSPRDPGALDRFFADLQRGRLLTEPGAEAFVATIDGEPCGLVSVHPDKDYFTGHPRAYVDILVVARQAEGRGVGRALMDYVERWARDRAFREVVLDVFADNQRAIAFYERQGYRPDHIRMAKPLE